MFFLTIFNSNFIIKIINNNNVFYFKSSDNINFKRKLLYFLISFICIIPINTLAYSKYLIPGGENIGIKVNSDGVFVVGFYKVNGEEIAKNSGFMIGDRIISINDNSIHNINDLVSRIENSDDEIKVEYGIIRDNKKQTIKMSLKKSQDNSYKTGIYVKDGVMGIGTLTFIDPETNKYGALGHEITDNNNGFIFTVNSGNIYSSKITSITKASLGKPGEKNANINTKNIYGNISNNLETGIYGTLNKKINNDNILEVMNINDVKIGNAEIITTLSNNKKESFNIKILSIDKSNKTKNFLIEITDTKLIKETGGIVKGMSGSPIIQDGKIVGAITHTVVDNPKKGYGISIERMLESME